MTEQLDGQVRDRSKQQRRNSSNEQSNEAVTAQHRMRNVPRRGEKDTSEQQCERPRTITEAGADHCYERDSGDGDQSIQYYHPNLGVLNVDR